MTTKIVTIFKYITIISIVITSMIACETDFENVGGDLVDNGIFNTKKTSNFRVIAYSKNLESSRVDNIQAGKATSLKTPLGINDNEDFGLIKASTIAQIRPPSSLAWGDSPNLDAVYLEIPYDATSTRETTDTKPKFKLNNIIGDENVSYQIRVVELDTYLSRLDAIDPSKAKKYFSDEVFSTNTELYAWNNFKPESNDTIEYYNRTLLDVSTNGYAAIQVQDSIKYSNSKPFIRFLLNKTFFENNFINTTQQSVFDNVDDFNNHFKGIVIEVQGSDGSIMMLDFSQAKINLYLTNTEQKTAIETDVNKDLDGDGDIDGTSVTYPVRTAKVIPFSLSGIRTNQFVRDYTSANGMNQIFNPDMVDGEKKLFIQGAAGSIGVIDLFNQVALDTLRPKNWLINEANLTFHIDNQNGNNVPNRLLLYKLDTDETNDTNENAHLLDMITENAVFNGYLQKDDDDPTKYKVNITDYISEVLKKDDFSEPVKLGLKVYNDIDKPLTATDTVVSNYSWNPQGVVLYGNKYLDADTDYSKRLKLEVYYTELNN